MESDKLVDTLNILDKETLNYIAKRKYITEYILNQRKQFVEEYKDDEDKIIAAERLYEDFCKEKENSDRFMGKIIVDRAFCGDVYRFIKNNGGTVQFYFEHPLQYKHGDICSCRNYDHENETYNHIDFSWEEQPIWASSSRNFK